MAAQEEIYDTQIFLSLSSSGVIYTPWRGERSGFRERNLVNGYPVDCFYFGKLFTQGVGGTVMDVEKTATINA